MTTCTCYVDYDEPFKGTIDFCPLHAAAGLMRNALKMIERVLLLQVAALKMPEAECEPLTVVRAALAAARTG